jgi:hypothetical protein
LFAGLFAQQFALYPHATLLGMGSLIENPVVRIYAILRRKKEDEVKAGWRWTARSRQLEKLLTLFLRRP